MLAQDRAQKHVSQPPLGQVDDFGKDRFRVELFLRMHVMPDGSGERRIAMAEAAHHARTGRAEHALHVDLKFATVERLVRRSDDRRHHGERIG